jgi:uncharacterized protein
MRTRRLGRTGLAVSEISLGTEYLLGQPAAEARAVIREAIAGGMNYFDLFCPQPAFRDIMGEAFIGQREKVFLTAHLGSTAQEDGQYAVSRDIALCGRFFEENLRRMRTDHVDVLFLHNVNTHDDTDQVLGTGGLLDLARRLQRQGKARFIGFSGHNVATSRQAVESDAIDVLMFPINMAGLALPGLEELSAACKAHDVGVVAMKCFGGGSMLRPETTITIEDYQMGRAEMPGAPTKFQKRAAITPYQCLSYVLARPEVSAALPGCKATTELAQVLGYGASSAAQRDYRSLLPMFESLRTGVCVYCNHCLPCPGQIDIGKVLSLLDKARDTSVADVTEAYCALPAHASDCISCGDCTGRCPFGVDAMREMQTAGALFGS